MPSEQETPLIPDSKVGVTLNARRKADRFYDPHEARRRVNDLDGALYLKSSGSEHDHPEFHLLDPDEGWTLIFIVAEDKPVIITQCHRHWMYDTDARFTYIGGRR